ncbi:MAG: DUF488 family protein [Planctomycetota bacterium]|nr:DUF488 family protein [Planctomycetota bacterium]
MTLLLRTVQLKTQREPAEGLRIGAVRFLPRGVPKEDYARLDYFDVWLPTLAPSRELLAQFKVTNISIETVLKRYRNEMKQTEARQTIQLLAELAKRTPLAIGCYCEQETRCHRSELFKLIREAAGLSPELPLSEFCIYTIRHPDELSEALKLRRAITWQEHKPWTQGKHLLGNARQNNTRLPILFADATDCTRLTHWAVVSRIDIQAKATRYEFHSLRPLRGRHSPQELTLRSTGVKIAEGFIKPYAICKIPKFLTDSEARLSRESSH